MYKAFKNYIARAWCPCCSLVIDLYGFFSVIRIKDIYYVIVKQSVLLCCKITSCETNKPQQGQQAEHLQSKMPVFRTGVSVLV